MFDWDSANIAHIARHGITPHEAEEVITNGPVDLNTEISKEEVRITSVGPTDKGRFLVVITTERDDLVRVVTAFPATRAYLNAYLIHRGTPHDQAP